MKRFGLIGKKLSHSFSKKYFTDKFQQLDLPDHVYDLFELDSIKEVEKLKKIEGLVGFNITVPYKQEIIPYLSELDKSAEKVGAVNVVEVQKGKWIGYNSDYYGFLYSLQHWIANEPINSAIILGSGGASKAVKSSLEELDISYKIASRSPQKFQISYEQCNQLLSASEVQLIVNTTPLGMSPNTDAVPPIDFSTINDQHFLYDLIYNPEETQFLTIGKSKGAHIKNGLEMLHLQAEESWKIWNKK